MVTNIGQPEYGDYERWNEGECADFDAGHKMAITEALIENMVPPICRESRQKDRLRPLITVAQ